MTYTKTIWQNDSAPYLNEDNLNKIEQGIYDAHEALDDKQDTLESGVNIKTINNQPILGPGNINIQGGGGGVATVNSQSPDQQGNVQLTAIDIPTTGDSNVQDDLSGKIAAPQSPTTGNYLKWNGSEWVDAPQSGGDDVFELIETITLEEAVSSVLKRYDVGYKKLLVYLDGSSSQIAVWENFWVLNGTNGAMQIYNNSTKAIRFLLEALDGYPYIVKGIAESSVVSDSYTGETRALLAFAQYYPMTGFRWVRDGDTFSVGDVIHVYGVRV